LEEIYGEGTETLVMDEDGQALEDPIIAPIKLKRVEVGEKVGPGDMEMNVSAEYMQAMMGNSNLVRNITVGRCRSTQVDPRWTPGRPQVDSRLTPG
jgi:U5 small nuclear ribonucleoprotein component